MLLMQCFSPLLPCFFKGAPRTSLQVEECSGTQPTGVCHTLSIISSNNNNTKTMVPCAQS